MLDNISIKNCDFDDIKTFMVEYYKENKIIVDSFLESHIRESNFYKILYENSIIGYFAVHKEALLVSFNVFENYRNISQELFAIIKKYECIREAFVPTGDEFFMSHALDNYIKLEKQAYFSIYTEKNPKKIFDIKLELADIEKDLEILNICHDFLKSEIENIKNLIDEKIYIAKYDNNIIGFGVVEYQKIFDNYASIGMIVREEYRQKGYGANILHGLKNIVKTKGKTAISGCWYYNHNSIKTMESAGAYSKTRLIKFYF